MTAAFDIRALLRTRHVDDAALAELKAAAGVTHTIFEDYTPAQRAAFGAALKALPEGRAASEAKGKATVSVSDDRQLGFD